MSEEIDEAKNKDLKDMQIRADYEFLSANV
jgi:hypothetical protein